MATLGLLGPGCTTDWEETTRDGLRLLTTSGTTNRAGRFKVQVPVAEGETGMILTLQIDEAELGYVHELIAPDGTSVYRAFDWVEEDRTYTNAVFSAPVVSLNWPVQTGDVALSEGTWTVDLRTGASGEPIDVAVALKTDPSLTDGALRVSVVVPDAMSGDAALVDGIESALARWDTQLYGPYDLQVEPTVSAWDGPATLAGPGTEGAAEASGAEVLALSAATALDEVVVAVVDEVTGGPGAVLGLSGGIPGPLVPSTRSLVMVSASEARGADGVFSDSEVQLLSETFAHEVGHYLGLYHPVELPRVGGAPVGWDSLDDTPECSTYTGCVQALGRHLMFPTPVCLEAVPEGCVTFVDQTTLSAEQVGVMQRATVVR